MRPSGRAPDQMRAIIMEPGFTRHAEGSCLVSLRRHPGALHRVGRRQPSHLAARQGPRLGDGRIWHAAARDPYARPARGGRRQAVRPDPGDPAADRAVVARRGRPRSARRAPDHARLRRHPGRRRHPHRGHLRRLGGAAAGGGRAARQEADRGRPDPAEGRGGELRHPRRNRGARSRLCRGQRGRLRRQFRADRRRQADRDPDHARRANVSTRKACSGCFASPGSAARRSSRRRTRRPGR